MLLRNLLKLAGVLVVVAIVLFLRSAEPVKTEAVVEQPVTTTPCSNDKIIRGMALQISYTADGIDNYLKSIDEIADLGANTVGLSTAGYQENAGSSGITLDIRKAPTPQQFRRLINKAKSRGLKVILMPVVLLSNPRGSEWRGVIQPPDWNEWFASYLAFIKYFARVGLDNDADALVVGAELISTEGFKGRWTRVIEEVRRIFHGKLLYSSNWDHYRQVSFWDKLDWIGMTTYHKLSDTENPPLKTLIKNWIPIKKEILKWQKTINRPILFTEVGWCSQPGASIEAWNYYRHQSPSKVGLEEQKKCYQAFIKTWDGIDAVAGAMWWEWKTDGGGPEDYSYTPKGKPAQEVLRKWYREGK